MESSGWGSSQDSPLSSDGAPPTPTDGEGLSFMRFLRDGAGQVGRMEGHSQVREEGEGIMRSWANPPTSQRCPHLVRENR